MMLLGHPSADHRFDSVVQRKSGFIPAACWCDSGGETQGV